MDRERANALLPIIAAFANGAEIEFLDTFNSQWYPINSPDWVSGEYRIKPAPIIVETWALVNNEGVIVSAFLSDKAATNFNKIYRDKHNVVKFTGEFLPK